MSALPRAAATILVASLALLGGAATASAHPAAPAGVHQPADDGFEVEIEQTYVVVFGDLVLD
ncbi:hypothetical protein ACFQ8C_28580 [Streptomyces sp. NPDC056503]|uniref:hypothetical protein n=1 Tax=Streptomyces sp. NPDC056503 TaxID=3345842 RepID=UPI0036AD56E4